MKYFIDKRMKYFIEKRGSRELICVVDTIEEARAIVRGTGNIILCQTKARREELRIAGESVKRK
jgi:hypothetical protein